MRGWLNVMLSSRPPHKLIDHLQIHHIPLPEILHTCIILKGRLHFAVRPKEN